MADPSGPAQPGEFAPLRLGDSISLYPPVILAPMAGITSAPYRLLCAEEGAAMCVSEMVTASSLLQRNRNALKIATFHEQEHIKSVQLYGVRPEAVGEAVAWLVGERGAEHVDLNLGCPVRKVTSRGGGAAVPLKPRLLARLVRAAVGAAGGVPVTVKMRAGLDERLMYHLAAGRAAEDEGVAAVCLHARTAAQLYSPVAEWDWIGELAHHLSVPVLGNGDVFEAGDALRMMRETGAAGVMVGRANLGRPWVFREIADAFDGRPPPPPPPLGEVLLTALDHLRRLVAWSEGFGGGGGGGARARGSERGACLAFRKFVGLYLYGFESARPALFRRLMAATSLAEWEAAIADVASYDATEPFPAAGVRHQRLKGEGTQRVSLPKGYLDDLDSDVPPEGADEACEG